MLHRCIEGYKHIVQQVHLSTFSVSNTFHYNLFQIQKSSNEFLKPRLPLNI